MAESPPTEILSIRLSDAVLHDSPIAWMVFCYRDLDYEYKVFTEHRDAADYANDQAEQAGVETWPVYALWAADIGVSPT